MKAKVLGQESDNSKQQWKIADIEKALSFGLLVEAMHSKRAP